MNSPHPTVLLVDDDPDFRALLSFALEGLPLQLILTSGPRRALRACKRQRPDLVLCDVAMNGMRGPQLRRRMRTIHGGCPIPFLFVSAEDPESRELRDIFPVFPKYAGVSELRARVVEWLENIDYSEQPGPAHATAQGIGDRISNALWRMRNCSYPRIKRCMDIGRRGSAHHSTRFLAATLERG